MMTPEQKEAYESGYLSGFHNEYDCPYPKDSNEEEWWIIGYNEGADAYSRSFDL
jgi:hypothetical protein